MDDVIATFKADVRSKRGRLQEIADATGINPKVLRNILYDETKDPRSSNMDRLREFYSRQHTS